MENLEGQLRELTDQIENEFNEQVSFRELFDLGFLAKNSNFETLDEMFEFHDILVYDIEDFEALEMKVLDEAVEESTDFDSWDEMLRQAEEEHTIKKLKDAGFDISD